MALRARQVCLGAVGLLLATVALADGASKGEPYIFAWPFVDGGRMQPRGGTTEGPSVTPVTSTTDAFERLREPGLSKLERDRRAILAMAGGYRVSFDFLEVVGYAPDYEPARPYRSWGTEHIYVIADDDERISLQHLLVMTVQTDDGETQGPFVTKHWRQDWRYEAGAVHSYHGANTWRRESAAKAQRQGHWAQTVWHVDDSPRYAAWGEWTHTAERSTWVSGATWRPLPRREYSVRDDYDALIGTNRHTVLPTGWVQEQRNIKAVLEAPGDIGRRVAKEYGVARYRRIKDYDFSAGDGYLEATEPFWALVRAHWDKVLAANETVQLKNRVEGAKLFEPLFKRAQVIADGQDFDLDDDGQFVRDTINAYLTDSPPLREGY